MEFFIELPTTTTSIEATATTVTAAGSIIIHLHEKHEKHEKKPQMLKFT